MIHNGSARLLLQRAGVQETCLERKNAAGALPRVVECGVDSTAFGSGRSNLVLKSRPCISRKPACAVSFSNGHFEEFCRNHSGGHNTTNAKGAERGSQQAR